MGYTIEVSEENLSANVVENSLEVNASIPGVSNFVELDDVPKEYSGHANKLIKVNSTEDGLEFTDSPSVVDWDEIVGDQEDISLSGFTNDLTTDDLIEGTINLYFTTERAQDAVGNILSSEFTYDDETPSISLNYSNISHTDLMDIGTNTHTQIDSHIENTSNPHSVRLDQIEDPTASHTISMGGNTLTLEFTNPIGGMLFDMTGGWSGHVLEIIDTTEVPDGSVGDHLLHLESNRLNVLPLHLVQEAGRTSLWVEGDSDLDGDVNIDGDLTATNLTGNLTGIDNTKITKLYQPDETNAFVYTDNSGTLHIDGDITQQGDTYETHAEQLYTTKDFIKTRNDSISGLSTGEISGIEVLNYDGTNSLLFGTDSEGYFKAGETDSLQILSTREDNPQEGGITYFNDALKRLDTSSNLTYDGSTLSTNGLNLSGNIALNGNYLSGDGSDEGVYVDSSGRVGIGTTGPDGRLHLHGTVNDKTRILVTNLPSGGSKDNLFKVYDSSGDGIVEVADRYSNQGTPDIKLHSNGDSYLNGGNVGIGTTSPDKTLHINSGSLHSSTLLLERTGTHANSWQIGFWGTNLNIHPTTGNLTSTDTFQLDTNMVGINKIPTEALDVSGNALITGNVGIGTTSPSPEVGTDTSLEIKGDSSPGLWIYDTGQANKYGIIGTSNDLRFQYGSNNYMTIQNDGKIGIGEDNPNDKVEITGTGDTGLRITSSDASNPYLILERTGGGYHDWKIQDYSSELLFSASDDSGSSWMDRMIIDKDGNIGIGTTSPDYKLDINGEFGFRERSTDPSDPDEGAAVIWMSDGTATGDDGDILLKVTAGGVTKTLTLMDFSAV